MESIIILDEEKMSYYYSKATKAANTAESWFEINLNKEFKIILEYHNKYFKDKDFKFSQKLFNYINKVQNISICPICKENELGFKGRALGYQKYCSKICKINSNMYNEIVNTKKNDPNHYIKRAKKYKKTMLEKYGVEAPIQHPEFRKKIENTNIKKYGFKTPFESNTVREVYKKNYLEKHGVDHNWKVKEVINKCNETKDKIYGHKKEGITKKIKETLMKRYNVDCSLKLNIDEIKEKIKNTLIERYGVDQIFKSSIIREKIKETLIERYGVDHQMKDLVIFERAMMNAFRFKGYELPSGKITRVQGYEPQALDKLFEMGYDESDIMIENKDIERYIGKVIYITIDGKEHRYYPDIYIVSENKIIEVKSVYTYNKNKEVNELKRKACLDAGLNFEFDIIKL